MDIIERTVLDQDSYIRTEGDSIKKVDDSKKDPLGLNTPNPKANISKIST